MTARDAANDQDHRFRRVLVFWQVVFLAIGTFVLSDDLAQGWSSWSLLRGYGQLGFESSPVVWTGFNRVKTVSPGGPFATLGVRPGNFVRFDRAYTPYDPLRAGEPVGFSLRREGGLSHQVAIAAPIQVPPAERRRWRASGVAIPMSRAFACAIGMFAILRSRGRASTLLFGAAVVAQATWLGLTLTESESWLRPAVILLQDCNLAAGSPLLLAFALAALRQNGGRSSRLWICALAAGAMALAFNFGIMLTWWRWTGYRLFWSREFSLALNMAVTVLLNGLAIIALGLVWRRSQGAERARYGMMLLAALCLSVTPATLAGARMFVGATSPWRLIVEVSAPVVGAAVFAYAVLRHRVIDPGFAVNRTLVFGAVSGVLLGAFGLIEWAVDHLVKIDGREANAFIDAGVALAVFLTFHRVRDAVEHVVEALFFKRWQEAEAALRRFVAEAAFVTDRDALLAALAAALSRFADGAAVAIYLPSESGGLARAAGMLDGVASRLDENDPALVRMRAERRAVEPQTCDSALIASLCAPLVKGADIGGAVLLGPKPNGMDLRPDETDLVGWACLQAGLDLHALEVRRLRESLKLADARMEELRAVVALQRV